MIGSKHKPYVKRPKQAYQTTFKRSLKRPRKFTKKKGTTKRTRRKRVITAPITDEELDSNVKLQSTYMGVTSKYHMPYVGYTVNPRRRRRQHRREITRGAWKTARMKGDFNFFAVVSGFLCKRDALQFEWSWNRGKMAKPSKLKPADGPLYKATWEDVLIRKDGADVVIEEKEGDGNDDDDNENKNDDNEDNDEDKEEDADDDENDDDEGDTGEEEEDENDDDQETKEECKYMPTFAEVGNVIEKKSLLTCIPTKKLLKRVFAVLSSHQWTSKAISTNDPRRTSRPHNLTIHWYRNPRLFGVDPQLIQTAVPVHHIFYVKQSLKK